MTQNRAARLKARGKEEESRKKGIIASGSQHPANYAVGKFI
jgi:hypothetical protein